MEFFSQVIDIFLHVDKHLNDLGIAYCGARFRPLGGRETRVCQRVQEVLPNSAVHAAPSGKV